MNSTPPNGTEVSRIPALPPAWTKESTVPTADRVEDGEMLYPYEQTTVPPWAFMNASDVAC